MTDTYPSWYHGSVSAEEATEICVKVGHNGAFLVRPSRGVKGAFTLSVFVEGQVYHHRILPRPGNRVMLESSQKEFDSLEKLVDQYKASCEDFIHPLTIAIFPSLVKQLNENNWKPDVSSPESPVYVERKEVKNPVVLPPTPIPEPFITIKLPTKLTVAPKPNHVPPKVPPKSKSKPPAIPKIPQTPSSSFTSSATKKEKLPAAPPLSITSTPFKPNIKPKTKLGRSRSATYHVSDISTEQSSFTTFGKTDQEDREDRRSSRNGTFRPVSCVFPANDIRLVSDEDDPNMKERRRTLSANDMHRMRLKRDDDEKIYDEPEGTDMNDGHERKKISTNDMHQMRSNGGEDGEKSTDQKPETNNSVAHSPKNCPKNSPKSDQNKKSRFNFKQFLNRIGKGQQNPRKVKTKKSEQNVQPNGKQEEKIKTSTVMEKSDGNDNNNSQPFPEDYTPILCKTQFVATTDYSTSENALSFTKGTEMAVRGVRMDGWWYCENKSTHESGWVYMDYLKPKNEEWFEAKPVETTRDFEIYQQLDFSGEWDTESDDDTYCRYSFPVSETSTAGIVAKDDYDEVFAAN